MNTHAPTLAELQHVVRANLQGAPNDASPWIVSDGLEPDARLSIYRNTMTAVLANVLRLAFPAVQYLLGADCFEGAARRFMTAAPPDSAWLDEYGAGFPAFLAALPETRSISYLADVAHLEWQVNSVLHAPDAPTLNLAHVATLDEAALGDMRLWTHPAVRIASLTYPADAIWRAVLDQDDAAMHAIRLEDGPVHLLIQRTAEGVETVRLDDDSYRMAIALFSGGAIRDALTATPNAEAYARFASLLAGACFADTMSAPDAAASSGESTSCRT
ncbi:DNA-binding domain-containing protein [Burkholderia sp. BCC0397]|uniref:HvfC/BufC N-terminal domain-containing protein n=1 Tax=Burkholderia sp. BCC0397 TaxID=486876 RepID=UPI00158CD1C5|nr:DNA-binding domain-containing protein [Burkholderia sp. BCC0397]